MINIQEIDYSLVLPIWSKLLWTGRVSKIEPSSAIIYGTNPFEYDNEYMSNAPYCVGAYLNGELAGINTGHITGISFTSRGLYVFLRYRNIQVATALLQKTIDKARELKLEYIWTMPRSTSLPVYEKVGFRKSSEWFSTETSDQNCYARLDYEL